MVAVPVPLQQPLPGVQVRAPRAEEFDDALRRGPLLENGVQLATEPRVPRPGPRDVADEPAVLDPSLQREHREELWRAPADDDPDPGTGLVAHMVLEIGEGGLGGELGHLAFAEELREDGEQLLAVEAEDRGRRDGVRRQQFWLSRQ